MIYFYLFLILLLVIVIVAFVWINKLKRTILFKEEEIKELQNIFDNVPLFIDSFDETGKFTLWNKECQRVFGWTIEEINASANSLALFYPDEEDQKETLEKLHNAKAFQFIECYPRTKDGKVIISKWVVAPLLNGTSMAIGYDITQENLDKVKEKTLQLNETKRKLAELNISLEDRVKIEVKKNEEHQKLMILQSRHAQMGEIISMIAHQWRQPLNNLSLIIQDSVFQYKQGKFSDKEMQILNKESSNQIQFMSDTITNFKHFFKPEKDRVKFDISSVLNHTITIVQPILDIENINLEIVFEENIYIVGFPLELGQSVMNIMTNAKDALKANGIKEKSIQMKLTSDIDTTTITIKDNAGGIPIEIKDKIFDPYFSTKNEQDGTGLGLYITKIIIEDHMNGHLDVSSDEDGTVFSITFNR